MMVARFVSEEARDNYKRACYGKCNKKEDGKEGKWDGKKEEGKDELNTHITKKSYESIIDETNEGCYKDSGDRDLPTLIREAGGIPRNCFQMAKDKGFKYAGM